jgi:hypothetical protein
MMKVNDGVTLQGTITEVINHANGVKYKVIIIGSTEPLYNTVIVPEKYVQPRGDK